VAEFDCSANSLFNRALFRVVAELMRQDVEEEEERQWEAAVRRSVDTIAGLTAVDGATIKINMNCWRLVRRLEDHCKLPVTAITEPIVGNESTVAAHRAWWHKTLVGSSVCL
jgi:hypothetical protein